MTPSIPAIAYDNVPYTPTVGTSFIKASLVPTSRRPAVRGLNPSNRYQGIFAILICTPEESGSGAGLDLADAITDRFEATTDISAGGIIVSLDYAEVGLSYPDAPYYCTPVTIGWYIYN